MNELLRFFDYFLLYVNSVLYMGINFSQGKVVFKSKPVLCVYEVFFYE